MISIEEIKDLPDPIKSEILNYAEFLITKHKARQTSKQANKWADVSMRGRSTREPASVTIQKMRKEEKW